MKIFLTLDLETGGLDADIHGITEIAAVVGEHPGDWSKVHIVERFCALLRPTPGLQYTAQALGLQHRTLQDLEKGMSERAALSAFYGFVRGVSKERLSPWAHNASFDKGFLLEAHDRLNEGVDETSCDYQMLPFGTDFLCSMDLFKTLKRRGVHYCSRADLDTVLQHYGIRLTERDRHTGAGDVEATAMAIAAMMRDYRQCKAQQPAHVH